MWPTKEWPTRKITKLIVENKFWKKWPNTCFGCFFNSNFDIRETPKIGIPKNRKNCFWSYDVLQTPRARTPNSEKRLRPRGTQDGDASTSPVTTQQMRIAQIVPRIARWFCFTRVLFAHVVSPSYSFARTCSPGCFSFGPAVEVRNQRVEISGNASELFISTLNSHFPI